VTGRAKPELDPAAYLYRLEQRLQELLGGIDGGWSFWRAMLAGLEVSIERSRERECQFTAHPIGEWRRFAFDVDEAMRLGALAVEVQQLVGGELDGRRPQTGAPIADLLLERIRDIRQGELF